MDAEEGDYLGSEADLLDSLGVSRPTLRQAAKIAQADNMLHIRRGASGGFFAARPHIRDIVQAPAFFLRMQGASLHQMRSATGLITAGIVADATGNRDPDLRRELIAITEEIAGFAESTPAAQQTIDLDWRMMRIIAEMCPNPCLRLFLHIGYEFGLLERGHRFFDSHTERRKVWLELQEALCRAVLERREEEAQAVIRRRNAVVEEWVTDDNIPVPERQGHSRWSAVSE